MEYAHTQSDAAAAGPPPTQPCQSICCGAEELAPSRVWWVPRAKVAPRREALRSGADEERARACVCVRESEREGWQSSQATGTGVRLSLGPSEAEGPAERRARREGEWMKFHGAPKQQLCSLTSS